MTQFTGALKGLGGFRRPRPLVRHEQRTQHQLTLEFSLVAFGGLREIPQEQEALAAMTDGFDIGRPLASPLAGLLPVTDGGLVLPRCNTQAMQWHLEEISSQVAPGAHAVLIQDQAGWHTTKKLAVPENITLLHLPPRSPELNPVENIWQFLRDNWLSNRIFQSYEQIIVLCCEAWIRLTQQPWTIISIGHRKWAYGF